MLRGLIKMMYVNDTAWNRLVVDYCFFTFRASWRGKTVWKWSERE